MDYCQPGPRLNIKTVFPGMGIPMLKIRRSWDRLIFNMGMPIPVRRYLDIETHSPPEHKNIIQWNLNQNTNIFSFNEM